MSKMWNLVLYGAAGAILLWLNNTAAEKRQRWQEDHEQFKRDIRAHRIKIQNIIDSNLDYYEYQELIDLHYQSFRTADQAKSLLDDSRSSLEAIGQALVNAKEQRDHLKISINSNTTEGKKEARQEIDSLIKLRKVLFEDKDILKQQRDTFLSEVHKLNLQTRELKHTIRDNTGARGREWYDRLQQRIHGCSQDSNNTFSIDIFGFKISF